MITKIIGDESHPLLHHATVPPITIKTKNISFLEDEENHSCILHFNLSRFTPQTSPV